eukprot:9466659-Heterocapsa_arctica.AAC.1
MLGEGPQGRVEEVLEEVERDLVVLGHIVREDLRILLHDVTRSHQTTPGAMHHGPDEPRLLLHDVDERSDAIVLD